MRVAVVTESFLPSLNGVTTSVLRVLDEFAARGIEALVVCPAAGAPASYAGHRVVEHPAIAYRDFPVGIPTLALTRELADFAPDVVHVASPSYWGTRHRLRGPAGSAQRRDLPDRCRPLRRPLRHPRGPRTRLEGDPADPRRSRPDARPLEQRARRPRRCRHRAHRALGARSAERPVPPADALLPYALDLRAALPDGDALVGYIGRISPEKRVERLSALTSLPGAEIVVGGYGPSSARVASRLGTQARMLGRLDGERLPATFAALDVFVHTGTEETFGQTVQEAQASGTAVVAPHAGGPTDLIEHGVDGLLYAPESDSDLRRQVERLVRDPGLRARLGEAGRRRVLHRTWSALTDELLLHYETAGAAAAVAPRS
ncbi:glycosyltransferase [Rathayibacter oskolensis]|uniref:glycosyltransferase n=1 Tax=Rathayibacter oskolensis TaxID=1891671 RepID=UPI00265F5E58|nr:glycosyltransferase [Rathayibacter oskolensis]WKK71862.1 glycosyltransferase [Rathayibacter oskolensis]